MLGFTLLIISMSLLAFRASMQLNLSFSSTFLELLSGPLAMNWGIPPASHNMLSYLIAILIIGFYLVGVIRQKPVLRAFGLVCWGLFGFLGAFMYVT